MKRPLLKGILALTASGLVCFAASVAALMLGQDAYNRGDEATANNFVVGSIAAQRVASAVLVGGLVYLVVLVVANRFAKPHA